MLWQLFDLHEKECQRSVEDAGRVLPAYDQVLKVLARVSTCSIRAGPSA
jgi:glycyl-tRNA synthetase alpha subunit